MLVFKRKDPADTATKKVRRFFLTDPTGDAPAAITYKLLDRDGYMRAQRIFQHRTIGSALQNQDEDLFILERCVTGWENIVEPAGPVREGEDAEAVQMVPVKFSMRLFLGQTDRGMPFPPDKLREIARAIFDDSKEAFEAEAAQGNA